MALHPLQDKYSHTDKVTNFRKILMSDGYGGVYYLYFYEHVVYDNMKKNKNKKPTMHRLMLKLFLMLLLWKQKVFLKLFLLNTEH